MNNLTKHHLLPRSKSGRNTSENILLLKENYHRAFHLVFENDTPIEQIERILNINDTAIQGDFKQDILNILELYKGFYYHNGVKKGEQ